MVLDVLFVCQEYARRAKVKRPDLQEAIDAAWVVMGKARPILV